ncbi:MAG: hypothetical protein A2Y65_11705 [Deltaproteobacteria bacterium RBG_13_52_11]|nr:MAG: hypothetical protein A2Y65_11705 [Deltaproteobacteria bacterium RBG_13_52_11]
MRGRLAIQGDIPIPLHIMSPAAAIIAAFPEEPLMAFILLISQRLGETKGVPLGDCRRVLKGMGEDGDWATR